MLLNVPIDYQREINKRKAWPGAPVHLSSQRVGPHLTKGKSFALVPENFVCANHLQNT